MGSVKVRNISHLGEVDVPSIRREGIKPGEVVEVEVEVADLLDGDHFERVDGKPVGRALYGAVVEEKSKDEKGAEK